jgi:hypothetical protein
MNRHLARLVRPSSLPVDTEREVSFFNPKNLWIRRHIFVIRGASLTWLFIFFGFSICFVNVSKQ